MGGETIARNYAEALFELADRSGRAEEFGTALDEAARLLDESPDFRLFLDTPRIETQRKKEVVRSAFAGQVPDPVLNFLLVVLDKRRHRLLGEMAREYRWLVDERLGRAHVEVSVARSIDEAEETRVAERLSAILGRTAIPHVRVDPALIGGIIFRSGDTIFDGSVRRRLQRMRRQLMAADVSNQGTGL
jgi:F-type H+-transporting ATPase subunit delta